MAKVTLYSTSCAATLKMKTDISRVKQLLLIKKVEYEEVSEVSRRQHIQWDRHQEMLVRWQVDLAAEPKRRSEMVTASEGVTSLPQLHLNNKYLGDFDTLQDMEDFGELDAALKAPEN